MSLLKEPKFLEEEKDAPLLNLHHNDVLVKERDHIEARTQKWKKLLFGGHSPAKRDDAPALETPRIIILDAERTFITQQHKQQLIKFLTKAYSYQNGDYSQAMCYASAFMMLILDEETTMDSVLLLHSNPKYVPGYWKREAVAAATDAYVFHTILQSHFPNVALHLNQQNVFPENYCQKWFGGLCTQILPFEALFPFFDNFLELGFKFLFMFGLSLVDTLKDELLAAKDFSRIFGLLRLDPKYVTFNPYSTNANLKKLNPEHLVKHARSFNVNEVDFAKLRKELYEKHLKTRMENAKQFFEEKTKEDNDNDDDSLTSDSELEEGEDCNICHVMMPELTCKICELNICENCHKKGNEKHVKTHKVIPYEPKEEEEEDDKDVDELTKKLQDKAKIED